MADTTIIADSPEREQLIEAMKALADAAAAFNPRAKTAAMVQALTAFDGMHERMANRIQEFVVALQVALENVALTESELEAAAKVISEQHPDSCICKWCELTGMVEMAAEAVADGR